MAAVIGLGLVDVPWYVTNDSVMGGLSAGEILPVNKYVEFSGNISTENNGGFTSTYRPVLTLLPSVTRVKISVKGDGNDYQLRLKSNVLGRALAYKVLFSTSKNNIVTYQFELSDFIATHRGRPLTKAAKVVADNITHVGFLIGSKQPKAFLLEIHAIEFY